MRNLIGQQIGPYKIEALIGAGGMADVYRAHQANLDRYVAIKVLKASLADDPEFVARFSREAMASGGLRHPNILRIYDAGTFDDRHYIVMDYANGGTLAERAEKKALTIDEVVELGIQIAQALDYAHKRSHPIIHRDLKPSNILLDDDRPLLADFGIAYMVSTEKRLTQTGASLGTPEYMSPEQSEGYPVDGRTDIYSLGVILFQLVTGRVPFQAKTPVATMHEVVYTPPPMPRQFRDDVPDWMESIILRALAKRPEDRFATAGEMADALRKRQVVPVAAGTIGGPAGATLVASRVKQPTPTPVRVERPGTAARPAKSESKSRVPLIAVAVVAVLAVVGVGAFLAMPALRGGSGGGQAVVQSAGLPPAAAAALATPVTATPTPQAIAVNDIATPAGPAGSAAIAAVAPSPSPLPPAPSATPTLLPPTATAAPPTATPVLSTATALPPTNTPLPPTSTVAPPTSRPTQVASATSVQSLAPTQAPAYGAAPAAPAAAGSVLGFETAGSWQIGEQKYGSLTQSTEQVHSGKYAAKLTYDFPAVADEYVVFLNRAATAIPGKPAALTAWVYGDGSGHFLNVWVKDSAGQVRQFTFGRVSHAGWQQMTAPLDTGAAWPQGHISGPDSAQLAYPLSLNALVLDAVPHETASTGNIFVDDVEVGAAAAAQPANVGGTPSPTPKAGVSAKPALAWHIIFRDG